MSKRMGLLYRKFNTGGPITTPGVVEPVQSQRVGHERGRSVMAPVRMSNASGVKDVVEQGMTDSSLVPEKYSRVGEDLYYENNKMPAGTKFYNGKPQQLESGRFVPSPTGTSPATVPQHLANRFNVGPVLKGVQSFNFKDGQFAGKYSSGQTQKLFLRDFFRANPNMRQVIIDGNMYNKR